MASNSSAAADQIPATGTGSEIGHDNDSESVLRRSWRAIIDIFHPFSPSALATLPKDPEGFRQRATRADRIPETEENDYGQRPTVRDYHSINTIPPRVRVPKKIATPIRVEGKMALLSAWVSYLNVGILLGTFSLALFNASHDQIALNFSYAYAIISVGILIYGYVVYQRRITMIKQRYPGHFDQILGPVIICVLLFFAVLANFILRVRELYAQ